MKSSILLATGSLFLLLIPHTGLHAADFNWTGASPLSGGNSNMSNPANWSGGNAPPNTGGTADLIFSGIARTSPNADVNYTLNTIRFTSAQGFTVGGNAITLQTDASVAPLIRNEASVLNRINNNLTFSNSGSISAQSGNLTLGGVLGTGLTAGNTVTLNADTGRALIVDSTVGGFGSLAKTGDGTVRFNALVGNTGAISFGGGTTELSGQIAGTSGITLTAGTVRLLANNRIPTLPLAMPSGTTLDLNGFSDEIGTLSGSGSILLGSGGVLAVNQSATTTFSGAISGTDAAGLTKSGTGTLTLSGSSSYSGPTTVGGGLLRAGAGFVFSNASSYSVQGDAILGLNGFNQIIGGLSGNGTVNLSSGNLAIIQTGNTEFSGTINGTVSSSLTKGGTGTLHLSGSNAYSGLTTVSNGRLVISDDNSLGSDAAGTTVMSNGTLEITASLTLPAGESITLGGNGSGGLGALRAHAETAGFTAMVEGDITLTADTLIRSDDQDFNIANLFLGNPPTPGTFALGTHQLTLAGNSGGLLNIVHNITGSGPILVDRPGATTSLNAGSEDFTGAVTALPDSNLSIPLLGSSGGTLRIDAGASVQLSGLTTTSRRLELGGLFFIQQMEPVSWNGSGEIHVSPGAEFSVLEAFNSNPAQLTLQGTGAILGAATVKLTTQRGNNTIVIDRPIHLTGNHGLEINGLGTVQINQPATYNGPTELKGGTLLTGVENALPAGPPLLTLAPSVFNLNNFNQRAGGLSGGGSVNLGNATLTLNPSTHVTHSGTITQSGAIVIEGNGTSSQSFSFIKQYNGPTVVRNNGRLRIIEGLAIPLGTALTVDAGGVFLVETPVTQVGSIEGAGDIELASPDLAPATLYIGEVAGTRSYEWSGTISGLGGIIKQGTGTFTANAATFDYNGETRINNGTLMFGASTSISSSPVVVESAGRLHASGTINLADIRGTINPGIAPAAGGLLFIGNTTLRPNSAYEWKLTDWNATPGSGADLIEATTLNFLATPAEPLRVRLEIPASLANFSNTPRTFKILTTVNFSGSFTEDAVAIDYLENGAGLNGTWAVQRTGNDIELVYTPGTDDTYQSWIAGFDLPGQDGPGQDPDADGIPNAIEFVLGGNPKFVDDSDKLPTSTVDDDDLVFVFRRTTRSIHLDPAVYHSTTLQAPWTKALHGIGDVVITTAALDAQTDEVTVRIPMAGAPRRFARLEVIVP